MPSIRVNTDGTSTRVYLRPGSRPVSVPRGSTVEQAGRGVIQKNGGKVSAPATGKKRK